MGIQKEYWTRCGGKLIPFDNAAQYFSAHPGVVELLPEAVRMIDLPTDGGKLEVELDFGRALGPASLLQTAPIEADGEATFAWRPARREPSRVVVADAAQIPMISTCVVVGKQIEQRVYRLITAYIGVRAPGEPWSVTGKQREESLVFWRAHALVWTTQMGEPFHSTWEEVLRQSRV